LNFVETSLEGVIVIEPKVFVDERGFFLETFRENELYNVGITENFVQHNHSHSSKNVLRGIHYQLTNPQGKLVRVASGSVFDVVVDVRKGSPTFGKWYGMVLDDKDMKMLYVPPGYGHAYIVLSDKTDFIYMCTEYYHPESEQGVLWNDPDIGIEWPSSNVILSEKDKQNPTLSNHRKLPAY